MSKLEKRIIQVIERASKYLKVKKDANNESGLSIPDIAKVRQLHGGVTNQVYHVEFAESSQLPKQVIVRLYGSGTSVFFNREHENMLLRNLWKKKIGGGVIYEDREARIEHFIEGTCGQPASTHVHQIGKAMRALHEIPIPEQSTTLWNRLEDWRRLAGQPYNEIYKNYREKLLAFSAETGGAFWNENVLCHGDLTPGNVILMENKQLNFIDFEYSMVAPRAFELANYFCEYGTSLLEPTYPEKNIREKVIETYLKGDGSDNDVEKKLTISNGLGIVDGYSVLSHYYWGLWGIIQAKQATIDFDYNDYAKKRLDLFKLYASKTLLVEECNDSVCSNWSVYNTSSLSNDAKGSKE